MKLRPIATAVILSIAAAACANSSEIPPGDRPGISYSHAADSLVLRIDTSGGFVPPSYAVGQIPGFSVFGDGRVITTGAQIEIYPQPALPPVLLATVDAGGMQDILRAALDAGLGSDADYTGLGSTLVADAPTTTFTLAVNGATHTVRVYALGELGTRPDTMTPDEYAARRALIRFSMQMGDLRGFLPPGSLSDDTAYTPDAMRLFVSDYLPDPTLEEPPIAWPGSEPLATFGSPSQEFEARCGVVDGDELAALMPLAERANQLTPWRSGGARHSLVFRPLLPDESGC